MYILLPSSVNDPIETLPLVVVMLPSGPIQVIITELDSTPLTVLTVQLIPPGLPTAAFCMGPDGDMVTVGVGTVCRAKLNHKME